MKFSIGQNVIEKKSVNAYHNSVVHKVVGIIDTYYLIELVGISYDGEIHKYGNSKPGERGWTNGIHRHTEEELFSLSEATDELRRLEHDKDKLDQEFDVVREQVKSKLEKAALLVQEAGAIVVLHDRTFFDLKQECMPLYQSLKVGGWSHSHMQC